MDQPDQAQGGVTPPPFGGPSVPLVPPYQPPPAPARKSFFHQAATASVWLIFLPFFVQIFSATIVGSSPDGAPLARFFFTMVVGLMILSGILLGIISLFGISKYGTKGILIKALCGILIPLLLALLALGTILHAREMAKRIREQQLQQQGQ